MSLTAVEETGERRRKHRFYKVTSKVEWSRHYYYDSEYDDIDTVTTDGERNEHDCKEEIISDKEVNLQCHYQSEYDCKEEITSEEEGDLQCNYQSEYDCKEEITSEEEGFQITKLAKTLADEAATEIFHFMTEITDNREIFTNVIRELIWNSNDALEEVRNKSSTYSSKSIKDLKITIELNKQTNTLTITDTGEGMEEDVLRNLGSITKYNKRCAKKFPQSDISKFSVCFYFAYLIADKVVVKTKHNDDKGYILEAESNTVTPNSGQCLGRGTEITLHLKEDQAEYFEIERIKKVIKKHRQFCRYPINLFLGKEHVGDISWEDDNNDTKDIQKVPCISEEVSEYSTFHGYKIRTAIGGEIIKKGLRVLPQRSKTRLFDEFANSGFGTICQVTTNGAVRVQWDLSREITVLKKGQNDQYGLLLFDNAQIEVKHTHVQCNECKEYPLRGIRWKCADCKNYDLCTKCYMNNKHIWHTFRRIQSERAKGVKMNARYYPNNVSGIVKGAKVQLRQKLDYAEGTQTDCNTDDEQLTCRDSFERVETDLAESVKMNASVLSKAPEAPSVEKDVKVQQNEQRLNVHRTGTVTKVMSIRIEAFRSDAKVKWKDTETRYPVGRNGKCELKFTKEAKGLYYYEDHLPTVSIGTASTGNRVVRGKQWNTHNNDDGGHGFVGTIIEIIKNSSTNSASPQEDQKEKDQKSNSHADLTDSLEKSLTHSPEKLPTDLPIKTPMESPIKVQPDRTIKAATDMPIKEPTEAPIKSPTEARIQVPTDTPIKVPTETPIKINNDQDVVRMKKNSSSNSSNLAQDEKTNNNLTSEDKVVVQWDNGNIECYAVKEDLLRILDNRPSGVEHEGYYCDSCYPPEKQNEWTQCIKGIRWKCLKCYDLDLCTDCYMDDKHVNTHMFKRFIDPKKREPSSASKCCRKNSKKYPSFGIFKEAQVVELHAKNNDVGIVIDICDCLMDKGRSVVEVNWTKTDELTEYTSYHDILELLCTDGSVKSPVHYDHLPALGKVPRAFFEVDFVFEGRATKKKINVNILRNIPPEKKETYKPSLFVIFADHPELDTEDEKRHKDEKQEQLVDDVIEFAKKTKLPCQIAGKKIMFYGGSSNSVFIHYKTEKDVIKDLVKKGFRQFERGDVEFREDEIAYFKHMAEYVLGERVLPVIISLRKGALRKSVMRSAGIWKIPIIRLKKHTYDVTVLTPIMFKKGCKSVRMSEYNSDVKNPWSVKKMEKSKVYVLGRYDNEDDPYEISLLSEVYSESKDNLDALICHLIIGVSMESGSTKKKIYGKNTDMYPNALSMYLLKQGKWKIPKEHIIRKSFNQRSIEYIYEQNLASEFESGLWLDLELNTQMAYQPPRLQDSDYELDATDGYRFSDDLYYNVHQDDSNDSVDSDNSDSSVDSDNSDSSVDSDDETYSRNWTRHNSHETLDFNDEPNNEEKEKKLTVSIHELYGLIYFALLQKEYWDGAKQLIETGFIRIRHILIGCVILDTIASNWRTAPLLQEKLRRLNKVFTKRAIRILSCIYEADKKKENETAKQNEYESDEDEDEHINHAGRLLLNHRYIEDTIKTQNKTFLDNPEVKNIINKMWYGCEQVNAKTIVSFIALACCHIIILPVLMISLESRPLRPLYNKYKLPFVKVFINMLGFLSLLLAYAYMLLFDYNEDGISNTDIFIITWMVSFLLDEIKQHIVAMVRKKWKNYANDWWNRLDWISMTVYFLGMLFRLGETTSFRYASKILLVLAFMMLCIRILNLFCMSEILGPKLVMIRKMFSDTFAFMIIMTVIMMCYNISLYALLYPNSELSWSQIEKITQNGYWMLFGELNLDGDTLIEPDCSFNRTIYQTGILQRCPEQLGLYLVPYLKAFYGLIAVIMLLNLLIAMYSDTFQQVHKVSEFYWSQLQTNFLEEYSVKTIFPIHLQLLALPMFLVQAFLWICRRKVFDDCDCDCVEDNWYWERKKSSFNSSPMFVRVFLYDTNFDLMLESTIDAEGNGALMAKGEIDVAEADRITILQTKLDSNCDQIYRLKERNDKQNQKVLNKQKEMDKNLKELKKVILDRLDTISKRLTEIDTTAVKTYGKLKEAMEDDNPEYDHSSSDEDEDDSEPNYTSSDEE